MARESLGSRLGFLLLTAGCAIGLGNIWRFPFITGKYGGAAFVLLYLVFLAVLGFPLLVMELAIGRASRQNLYGAMTMASHGRRFWRTAGAILSCGCAILMMYYTTVTGWLFSYMVKFAGGTFAGLEPKQIGAVFGDTIGSAGECVGYMILAVFLGCFICGLGLRQGVERVTKVLMGGLFLLLIGLCVHASCLPGAAEAMKFYLMPDWSRFSWQAVPAAMGQAFFTLSIGIGSITIFGSYIDKQHSLAKEALVVIGLDTSVALLAGMVIFPVCISSHVPVGEGPGLIFMALPNIFCQMPGGRWWGALFFLFMCMAALTTVIAVMENLISILIDEWHVSRRIASLTVGLGMAVLSLPCALGFNVWKDVQPMGKGSTILDFEDYLVSDNLLVLGGLLLMIFCCTRWGWGWEKFLAEANAGNGVRFPAWARPLVTWGLPALILILYAINFKARWF